MQIKYKDYVMVANDERFNLYREYVVRNKKAKSYGKTERTLIGYGFHLDRAIQRIIELEVADKNATVTISEYLKLYRTMVRNLKDELAKVKSI